MKRTKTIRYYFHLYPGWENDGNSIPSLHASDLYGQDFPSLTKFYVDIEMPLLGDNKTESSTPQEIKQ